ncbi:hypothetical protein KY290_025988 [Solanum tuberosum]|uniref:Retroviral polymerase SH3-like domain-containing protein n=1 Tax=Solanum tuberosum TaxID=4113 RepID=A0ABQ7UV81_SOLTU|nr:hypothetical protein KY284_024865 [Solanum tuberosum]KAH0677064.1 hypothetical protein KY285_024865 [Solanum tuberosum]KAH0755718.1 hypothetical protein KY290_025988 [Solanum tuberosum]
MKNHRNAFSLVYNPQSKAYRLYNPTSGKVIISRNVVFNEEAAWEWNDKEEDSVIHIPVHAKVEHTGILETTSSDLSSLGNSITDHSAHGSSINSTPSCSYSPPLTSSSETPPTKFRSLQDVYVSCSIAQLAVEPTCYGEAAKQPE